MDIQRETAQVSETWKSFCNDSRKGSDASDDIRSPDGSSEEDTFSSDEREIKKPTRIYGRRFSNVIYTNDSFIEQEEQDRPSFTELRSRSLSDASKSQISVSPCAIHSFDELIEPDSQFADTIKSKQPYYIFGRRPSNATCGRLYVDEPTKDYNCTCRGRSFSDSFDGITYSGAMDNISNRVYISLFWNTFGRKGKEKGELSDATHVHHIYNGVVLVTDRSNNRLQFFSKTGNFKFEIDTGCGSYPTSSVLTNEGDIVCTLPEQSRIVLLDLNGTVKKVFENSSFGSPSGIAVDHKNHFYIADSKANKVYVLHPNGSLLGSLGQNTNESFSNPRHVTVCKYSQNILVSDSGNNCIKVFDRCGELLRKFGCYGRGDGQFRFPCGITTDVRGNMLVADHYNDRVSLFSPEGEFLHHIIGPERNIKRPQGIELRLGKINPKLYVTHGNLMATRVSVFKLRDPTMNDIEVEVLGKV